MTDRFGVKYVGPFSDGVEENHVIVHPGEMIQVDEERAAHLIEGDAWELVGKKIPKAAPVGETVAVEVPPGDVHAVAPIEEPASSGKDAET